MAYDKGVQINSTDTLPTGFYLAGSFLMLSRRKKPLSHHAARISKADRRAIPMALKLEMPEALRFGMGIAPATLRSKGGVVRCR